MTSAELLARLAQRPTHPIDFKDFGFGAAAYQYYQATALRARAEFDRAPLSTICTRWTTRTARHENDF